MGRRLARFVVITNHPSKPTQRPLIPVYIRPGALNTLFSELVPDDDPVFGSAAYKKQLAVAFLYKVKHL